MSEEIASADSLLTAITELRAALAVATAENEQRLALERRLTTERDQALAKVEGLNLAADQYSESRDQWMLKAKAATRLGARAQAVVDAAQAYRRAVTDLNGIAAAEERLWAALDSYEAAQKARME